MKGPKIIVKPPGPVSKELMEKWSRYSLRKASFTSLCEGEGVLVKDVDDNIFLNFADLNVGVGQRNPRVLEAVKEQLNRSGAGTLRGPSTPKIKLIEKLKEIVLPHMSDFKFVFCNTGSDASEFSMSLARIITGKSILLSYLGGHYGYSIGTLSLIADTSNNRKGCLPLVPGVQHVPYPNCFRCVFNREYPECDLECLHYLKYLTETVAHPDEIAAIFIEPIQQVGGVIIPPNEYFTELEKFCRENEILMVDDEVATGLGRTGKMFGIEHYDIKPEIMFLGKSFGNGIAIAGIIVESDVIDQKLDYSVVNAGSFSGNPISCSCAVATISEVQEKELLENSAKRGIYFLSRLKELSEKYEVIGDVRGKGLLIGIELVKENNLPSREDTSKVITEAFTRGLILSQIGTYKNILRVTPPLIVSQEEIDKAVEILDHSFRTL